MSASLVGSEMCIRDSTYTSSAPTLPSLSPVCPNDKGAFRTRLQRRSLWPWTTPCAARGFPPTPCGRSSCQRAIVC
eukprot:11051218-Alexandrium_andersonii.AAC.1